MGFFSDLFGEGAERQPGTIAVIRGGGLYECPAVGESHYQDALEAICGGRTDESAEERVTAWLVLEPENPYDEMAVRVDVDRRTVGYLDRDTARSFRAQLAEAAPGVSIAQVSAVIRGGWERGDRGRGHFGIWLDIPIRDRPTKPPKGERKQPRSAQFDDQGQPNPAFNAALRLARDVDELLGWCRGILADERVTDKEASALEVWMSAHPNAAQTWPGNVIGDRLRRIFLDGELHADELEEFGALLRDVTTDNLTPSGTTTLPLDIPAPDVEFAGRTFCLTGNFLHGTRAHCESELKARRATVIKAPRRNLDYLVLGVLGSRDWIHSAFGRKIEQVMRYKQAGQRIAIISEQHWAAFL